MLCILYLIDVSDPSCALGFPRTGTILRDMLRNGHSRPLNHDYSAGGSMDPTSISKEEWIQANPDIPSAKQDAMFVDALQYAAKNFESRMMDEENRDGMVNNCLLDPNSDIHMHVTMDKMMPRLEDLFGMFFGV